MNTAGYYQQTNSSASDVYSGQLLKKYSEKVKGDKNPAFNHGGRLSPFSKKFIKYKTAEEADLKRAILFKAISVISKDRANTTLKYYTNKGMTNEQATIALSTRQATFTLEKCILKDGIEAGTARWQNRQDKWQATLNALPQEEKDRINLLKASGSPSGCGSSNICRKLCSLIDHEDSLHYDRVGELRIDCILPNGSKRYAFVDYNLNNKIIEFYGTYWHADPRKYHKDYLF